MARVLSTRLEGGIRGPIWWPVGAMCGKPVSDDLNSRAARMCGEGHTTLRHLLLSVDMEHGRGFQASRFTADTEIVVRMRTGDGRTVERRRALVDAPASWDVADLVDPETYSWDFGSDDSDD